MVESKSYKSDQTIHHNTLQQVSKDHFDEAGFEPATKVGVWFPGSIFIDK